MCGCSPPRSRPRRRGCAPASAAARSVLQGRRRKCGPVHRPDGPRLLPRRKISPCRGVSQGSGGQSDQLGDLYRDHAILATGAMAGGGAASNAPRGNCSRARTSGEIASALGFESESVFHRQFLGQMRMTPGAYAPWTGHRFHVANAVRLPGQGILAYHARDPKRQRAQRRNRIWKALHTEMVRRGRNQHRAGAGVGEVHAERKLGRDAMAALHAAALRILGLSNDVTQFETAMPLLCRTAAACACPCCPPGSTPCAGHHRAADQCQVCLGSAREIVDLAGEKMADIAPIPPRSAWPISGCRLLAARRYLAPRRAIYRCAQAVAGGKLDIENLSEGSAIAAEKALTAQRASAPGRSR